MKRVKQILGLLIVSTLLTGCVQEKQSMVVNDDGSMDLEWVIAYKASSSLSEDSSIDEDKLSEYKDLGYTVTEYTDGDYIGKKMSIHIENIDNVSEEETVNYDLSSELPNPDTLTLFEVKDCFLFKRYKANFTVSTSTNTEEDTDTAVDVDTEQISDSLKAAIKEYGGELSFSVEVPTKLENTNATSLNEEQTKATWDYLEMENNSIQFEFILYNKTALIITAVIALLVVALLISNLVLIIKKHQFKKRGRIVETKVEEDKTTTLDKTPRTTGKFFGQELSNQNKE